MPDEEVGILFDYIVVGADGWDFPPITPEPSTWVEKTVTSGAWIEVGGIVADAWTAI